MLTVSIKILITACDVPPSTGVSTGVWPVFLMFYGTKKKAVAQG